MDALLGDYSFGSRFSYFYRQGRFALQFICYDKSLRQVDENTSFLLKFLSVTSILLSGFDRVAIPLVGKNWHLPSFCFITMMAALTTLLDFIIGKTRKQAQIYSINPDDLALVLVQPVDSIHSNEDTDKVEEHGRLDDSTRACKATQVQENVNGALICGGVVAGVDVHGGGEAEIDGVGKIKEKIMFGNSRFFIATAFATGVILATGDVHMLPDYATSHLHRYLGLYSYWNSNLYGISGLLASLAA
ncbi:hypothetical protein Tco_1030251 [Tanacetum coccineum]|uniref:Uncharacterized protein n=1 Tax=Tanacetum coccineum TaxID=301880 RepID=A0ABQ5G747_9ASTR